MRCAAAILLLAVLSAIVGVHAGRPQPRQLQQRLSASASSNGAGSLHVHLRRGQHVLPIA